MVFVLLSIDILDHNTLGIDETDGSCVPCNHTDTGVHGRLGFHSRTYHRRLRGQKRNCLPLHVGAHQRTVGIVIFQEGNQRRRYREDHPRRYVHIFDDRLRIFGSFIQITARYIVALEMSLCIQGSVCLRHMIIIFFIRRHIGDLVRDLRICRIAHIDATIRCLNESVFIDSGIAGQRVDQANVRTFRRLNRAHSAVMRIVNISDFESGSVPGQTAGPQSGETSLVCQLRQRIVLVHKLGQLRGTEEFLHRCLHRFDIDQGLCRNLFRIVCGHSLPDHALQSGEADPVLVL